MSRAIRSASREEWLRSRRIGASDVAAIVGKSPYRTAWDVWLRLTGQARPDHPTEAMVRGVKMEPRVLALYAEQTGLPCRRTPPFTTWVRDDRPFLSATPDALTLDGGRRGGVEAKTDVHVAEYGEPCVIERWSPEAATVMRPVYALQSYSQLAVLEELAFVDLAVELPFWDLRVYRFERDRAVEEALVETVRAWYERHVVDREPPEIDASYECRGYLADAFRGGAKDLREGTEDELALARQIATADAQIKALKESRDLAANELMALVGEAGGLTFGGGKRVPKALVIRNQGKRTLDEEGLRVARPDLAEALEEHTRRGDPYSYVKTYNLTPASPQE